MFNRRIKLSCASILKNACLVLALLLVTEPTQAQTNEPAQVETKPASIAPGQSLRQFWRGPDRKIIAVPENDDPGHDADSKPKSDRRIGLGFDSATSPAQTAPERLSPDHPCAPSWIRSIYCAENTSGLPGASNSKSNASRAKNACPIQRVLSAGQPISAYASEKCWNS